MRFIVRLAVILSTIGQVFATTVYVMNTNDGGPGSLREAINSTNSPACTPCHIEFAIGPSWTLPPSGYFTIQLQSDLPTITKPDTVIDATTQTAFSGDTNPNGPEVYLDVNGNWDGITVWANNVTIRGLAIANFKATGIHFGAYSPPAINGGRISGNYIGVDPTGQFAPRKGSMGISVGYASNLLIGGLPPVDRNVISGNNRGIEFQVGPSGTGNQIRGNYIGTNDMGTAAIPNDFGIMDFSDDAVWIGGTVTGAGNIIAGNVHGIVLGTKSRSFIVENLIGLNKFGTPIGNAYNVRLLGPATLLKNVIAYGDYGVTVETGNGVFAGVVMRGNAFRGNTKMSIDLNVDGPDTNDPGDSDTGANNFQNYPVLTNAYVAPGAAGNDLTITYGTDSSSVAGTKSIAVEFYEADNSWPPQTKSLLGSRCVVGNSVTNATSKFNNVTLNQGDQIIATATSYQDVSCTTPNDGTSEFSAGLVIGPPPPAKIQSELTPHKLCYFADTYTQVLCMEPLKWEPVGQPCAPDASPCAPQLVPMCQLVDCPPCLHELNCPLDTRFNLYFDNSPNDLQVLVVDDYGEEVGSMSPLREPVEIDGRTFNQVIRLTTRPGTDYRLQAYPGERTPMSCVTPVSFALEQLRR